MKFMKIRKMLAVILAACLLAANVPFSAFADISGNKESNSKSNSKSTESVTDTASPSETVDIEEEASPSDAEYIEDDSKENDIKKENNTISDETNSDELSDTIVLTAVASDGVIVTMKADTKAFSDSKLASSSEIEGGTCFLFGCSKTE